MDRFAKKHSSVDKYHEAVKVSAKAGAEREFDFLPPWVSVNVSRLLRQVMSGLKDCLLGDQCNVEAVCFVEHADAHSDSANNGNSLTTQ